MEPLSSVRRINYGVCLFHTKMLRFPFFKRSLSTTTSARVQKNSQNIFHVRKWSSACNLAYRVRIYLTAQDPMHFSNITRNFLGEIRCACISTIAYKHDSFVRTSYLGWRIHQLKIEHFELINQYFSGPKQSLEMYKVPVRPAKLIQNSGHPIRNHQPKC